MNSIVIKLDNDTDLNIIYNQLKKLYPKIEIIKNIENTEDIEDTIVFEKYLTEFDYKYNNTKYVFNEPYLLTVRRKKGDDVPFWYCIEDEYLGIYDMEESQEEIIKSFYSWIDMLWNTYAVENDKNLTKGAIVLKQKVLGLIKEVVKL